MCLQTWAGLVQDGLVSRLCWAGGMHTGVSCACLFAVDVPMWLKSLRLHKYLSLFADLSYEEMLQISDEYLERKVCCGQCDVRLVTTPVL